jgi:hypothetical protein
MCILLDPYTTAYTKSQVLVTFAVVALVDILSMMMMMMMMMMQQ